jgi:hypothetical protein
MVMSAASFQFPESYETPAPKKKTAAQFFVFLLVPSLLHSFVVVVVV